MYISKTVKITKGEEGEICDCNFAADSEYGSYLDCGITGKMCVIDGGECPFRKDDIVQIEYKVGEKK